MRVAVLGAGIAGLVAAHRLAEAGHICDVYERWPGLGGQAATLDIGGGHRLERYYHHLFTSDRHIAALYDELGLGDELEWRPSSVGFFVDGRTWPFTTPVDLLRFAPLSPAARVRMGLAVIVLQRRHRNVARFEGETARDWVVRAMGPQAWAKVWGPLLHGKFGDRAEDISMAWLWSKLTLRRQVKGQEARQELLGYPGGSWETLLERLQASIEARGGRVLIDRPARRIAQATDGGFLVEAAASGAFRRGHDPRTFPQAAEAAERHDGVVATVPSDVFEQLLDPALAQAVGEPYWTNIADRSLPFVGLIEHTNFVEPERYGGRRFLYIANYLAAGHELLTLDADALLDVYEPGLRAVNAAFSRSWVRERWLFREPAAQPIVTVGYHRRIPPLETGVPGLVLANTTQIYPEDRGTNYSVRLGGDAASALERSRAVARP